MRISTEVDEAVLSSCTQQNSYSSYLLDTVATQWLDSNNVVTIVNYPQHGEWAANGSVGKVAFTTVNPPSL